MILFLRCGERRMPRMETYDERWPAAFVKATARWPEWTKHAEHEVYYTRLEDQLFCARPSEYERDETIVWLSTTSVDTFLNRDRGWRPLIDVEGREREACHQPVAQELLAERLPEWLMEQSL